MKKKTWKIIVRHLVLALFGNHLADSDCMAGCNIPFHYKGCKLPALFSGTLDTGKLSSTVLQDRYSSKLPCMV